MVINYTDPKQLIGKEQFGYNPMAGEVAGGEAFLKGLFGEIERRRALQDQYNMLKMKSQMTPLEQAEMLYKQAQAYKLLQPEQPEYKDIYTTSESGELFKVGTIPKSGQFVTPTVTIDPVSGKPISQNIMKPYIRPQTPGEEASRETLVKSTKDLSTYLSDATQSITALKKMSKYASELGDFKTGIMNQIWAKGTTSLKGFAKEPKITEYLGIVSQELIPAARKLMEEKGPITDTDIQRVQDGLGDITTPLETKLILLDQLRNKIKSAISVKLNSAGISEETFKKKQPQLYKDIFQNSFIKQDINKGGKIMIDSNGNKAIVYPDGSFEEIK